MQWHWNTSALFLHALLKMCIQEEPHVSGHPLCLCLQKQDLWSDRDINVLFVTCHFLCASTCSQVVSQLSSWCCTVSDSIRMCDHCLEFISCLRFSLYIYTFELAHLGGKLTFTLSMLLWHERHMISDVCFYLCMYFWTCAFRR